MKKLLIIILIIFANLSIFGQNTKKWNYVSPEDFQVNYSEDTSIHAVIISEAGKYYFDVWREELRLFEDVTRKIKIIDKKGLKYARLEIPYTSSENFEDIGLIQGYIYSSVNGKITKKRLKHKDIQTVAIDKHNSKKIIIFKDAKPGDIIVYRYSIATLKIVEPPRWYFQHKIPCLSSYFEINLPDFINYEFRITGSKYLTLKKREESYMNLDYIFHYNDPIPSGLNYRNGSFTGHANFSFQTWNYEFEMKDIPPLKKENFVDCYCNYRRSLAMNLYRIDKNTHLMTNYDLFAWTVLTKRLYLATVNTNRIISEVYSQYTMAPAGFIIYRVKDWQAIDDYLLKDLNFGIQLVKNWQYQEELENALKSSGDTPIDKMKSIYNYVRDNFQWTGAYSIFTDDDLRIIAKNKKGNSADINLMLVFLLKKAGLKAYPVLVKTIDRGHIDEDLATERQFNHVIAMVEINGKNYFLDAINKNMPWYLLDKNDLNGQGRVIKITDSKFVEIQPFAITMSEQTAVLKLKDNSPAECNLLLKNFGYFALSKKHNIKEFTENYTKKLGNIYNLSVNFDNQNPDTLKGRIHFTSSEFIDGKKIYPFDVFAIKRDFLAPMRNLPIYFGYKFVKNYKVTVQLPAGKEVSSVPKPFDAKINGLEITSQVKIDSANIILNLKIDNENTFYNAENYQQLRDIYFKMYNFIDNPIILN